MKKSTERPMAKLADAAFKQAARAVIERAEQTGTPVIVWENGAVREIDPKSLAKKSKLRKVPKKVAK